MSTERLVKAFVTGPAERLDESIRALVLDRELHLLEPEHELGAHSTAVRARAQDPCRPALDAAIALLAKLKLAPAYRDFTGRGYELADCAAYIEELGGVCSRLITSRNAEHSLAEDNLALLERLAPYEELTTELNNLAETERLSVSFGHIEAGLWSELRRTAEAESELMIVRTAADDERVYLVCAALPQAAARADEIFAELGIVPVETPTGPGLDCVPAERVPELRKEIMAARARAAELDEKLLRTVEENREELLRRYSWLRYNSEGYSLRGSAAVDSEGFHLVGWIPAETSAEFESACGELGCQCRFEKPGRADKGRVPVKFRTSFLTRIFAPFVEMYGVPAYGEIDPRVFMLISYTLLFGLMFGDVGQGAVLIILGIFFAKKKGMWLGRIIAAVGCSAVVFGFVYGSVFGNEHLLPGFKVLEGNGVVSILLMTAGVGVLLIIICGVLNIVTGFRQHDIKKAVFSANGICGVLFLAGLAVGVVLDMLLKIPVLSNSLYWFFLACMLLCIWFGDLLAWLCGDRKGHLPSVGMLIMEGFFDLFEAFLSWLSNCLSFLRVGTYAICHAIMMLIVYKLSATDGGYAIFGLVIGNIIVMGIEAVLVCIQVLRLEFYELFGRFYTGRGLAFEPVHIDYAQTGRAA